MKKFISKNQKELTSEQVEIAKEYAVKQINKFLSTKSLPKAKIKTFANNAYKVAGVKLPKKIRWFKSPEEMCKYWASVWASVWDSVGASVRASVGDSVRDSVGDSVRASVWASVRASVGDSVWDSVGASVRASVWDSVRAYDDANVWSFYGFFHEYFQKNDIVWLLKLSENVTGYAFYEKECWLVEKPKTLTRDEQGRLHNTKGKAIEWKDRVGYYFIHGVRFDEKTFKKVTKAKVTTKEVFSLENMEQRMACLKMVGVEKLLDSAECVGKKTDKGNELYLVKKVFNTDAYFLKYICPSTGRVYVSGIDPEIGEEKDPDACMAWKFNLTKTDYLALENES